MSLPNPTEPIWLPLLGYGVDIDGSRIETGEAFIERFGAFNNKRITALECQVTAARADARNLAEAIELEIKAFLPTRLKKDWLDYAQPLTKIALANHAKLTKETK